MMQLNDQEAELFRHWSASRERFVCDGVVDQDAFQSSAPSLLFLLKEVNDPGPGGGNWDLRKFIYDGARPSTFDNIARWVHGIRNLPKDEPWSTLAGSSTDRRRRELRGIAAMNLKKSPGGGTTNVPSFWRAVREDASYLQEQFALYRADVVICCGSVVAEAFDDTLKPAGAGAWGTTSRGVEFLETGPGKFTIAYSHPEARVSDNLL